MKEFKHNPYATNKGGRIEAPNAPSHNDPTAASVKGNDLRTGK